MCLWHVAWFATTSKVRLAYIAVPAKRGQRSAEAPPSKRSALRRTEPRQCSSSDSRIPEACNSSPALLLPCSSLQHATVLPAVLFPCSSLQHGGILNAETTDWHVTCRPPQLTAAWHPLVILRWPWARPENGLSCAQQSSRPWRTSSVIFKTSLTSMTRQGPFLGCTSYTSPVKHYWGQVAGYAPC